MIVYLTLTLFVLFAACRVRKVRPIGLQVHTKQALYNRIAVIFIFLALFAVSALRVNVGNDYGTYVEFMHRIGSGFTNYVPTEAGFNLLVKGIYAFSGFDNYLTVFALFAAVTLICFLRALLLLSDDFAWSFALFMLYGYYFQSVSTVRYYLALSLAMLGIWYVLRGDWMRFVLLVVCGSLFHKSLIVVLVLYPIVKVRWRRWMYALFALLCVSCLFLSKQYLQIVLWLYPSYEETAYLAGGTSLVNIVRCVIVLLFAALVCGKELLSSETKEEETKESVRLRFYYHANLAGLALYVFGSFLPIVSRIAYYLTITQILFVPMLLQKMPDKGQGRVSHPRRFVKTGLAVVSILYFAFVLHEGTRDGVRILPYQSFLFDEMPPILSEMGVH